MRSLDVGENLRLVPYWEREIDRSPRIKVVIDSGAAFGAGDHPTTLMALELIEMAVSRVLEEDSPRNMLDVGTGTGVLAIAGRLLGTGFTLGLDVDPAAIFAARRNLQLNEGGVANRVNVTAACPQKASCATNEKPEVVLEKTRQPYSLGSEAISGGGTDQGIELIVGGIEAVRGSFGIVAANLVPPVLLRLYQPLVELTERFLILSGIADEMVNEIIRVYGSGDLRLRKRLQRGGWNAVWLEKERRS